MKTVTHIARVLLGLVFLVFGLNGFLSFLPQPPLTGLAGQFIGAMYVSHYLRVVFALQIAASALLLVNRFVPAALAILAPLLVNIALFHAFMAPSGFAPAVIAATLWTVVFIQERAAFRPLLAARTGSGRARGASHHERSSVLSANLIATPGSKHRPA
ncbi:MAG TPA: DoxX family protein [Opitutaceae bacterium]|nr:DoxX family protein [Opitutaceae bacterium]